MALTVWMLRIAGWRHTHTLNVEMIWTKMDQWSSEALNQRINVILLWDNPTISDLRNGLFINRLEKKANPRFQKNAPPKRKPSFLYCVCSFLRQHGHGKLANPQHCCALLFFFRYTDIRISHCYLYNSISIYYVIICQLPRLRYEY